MPELPEVQTIVSELNSKICGRKILRVLVSEPKMVLLGPKTVSNIRQVSSSTVKKFAELLQGQKILAVQRRAKLLIFKLSGQLTLLAHLKMTGQFIFEDRALRKKTGGKYRIINNQNAPLVLLPCKHTHIIFYFSRGCILYFNDLRKFGYLKLIQNDQLPKVKELQEFGPEPLNKNFTLVTLRTAVASVTKRKIKEVLMDPKVVAGIGNIYSDEILFHSGVRPMRQVLSLKHQEVSKIFKFIKLVLKKAILAKGSSVGDFIRTDGSFGQMGKFHFVYGRSGEKCKRCSSIIKSVKIGGRRASYCPKCQE